MTDRELLELAAKAAGLMTDGWHRDGGLAAWMPGQESKTWFNWNPLTDDGDALRLAVKLNLITGQDTAWHYHYGAELALGLDPYAATRRAIVRAAAEIGRSMK
jgi:hypothetical protein